MAVRTGGMTTVEIVSFRRELAPAFQRLNLDWIERLFAVEEADRKVLGDPERAIVAGGGEIFFAMDGGVPIGTVAMILASPKRYELAKMAVAASHQGRGIGEQLGAAGIAFAREAGAETVFLRTNSRLANAIRLYERLGFRHAPDLDPPEYARADVYMELRTGRNMHKSKLAGFIIDCKSGDLKSATAFWSAALGMETRELPGEEGQKYAKLTDPEELLDIEVQLVRHESRVHLDIETDDIEAEVQRLEKLGAKRVEKIQSWWVMQAPTGQKFCVVRVHDRDFARRARSWG